MQMSTNCMFLLFLFMMVLKTKSMNFTPQNCGKEIVLHDSHGIIQTPNFPNAFPVPIKCRWIIDASNFSGSDVNLTIYIYFTQMFVTTGLNITEYMLYDKESSIGYVGQTIFSLPPYNSLEVEFVRTNCTYLVIDFELNQLQGNHIRALYHLMNVYGFNITYEISNGVQRAEWCTLTRCSLTGYCYASADFS